MELEKINKQIEQATACSIEKRKQLLQWFSKQNVELQIDVFKEQQNQFFKHKERIESSDVLALSAFFLAIIHIHKQEQKLKEKNKSQNLDFLRNISDFSIKTHKKFRKKEKREKLLNIWSVVQKLKSQKFSFRDISKYIKQRHRFEVSHTYISKMWRELKNEF
jgi:hypothetical protein